MGFICLGAIGDLLLLSALITALRERLPNVHIALLVSRANAATVSLIPGIDQCASFAVTDVSAMVAWLREQRLDVLIDSTQWARLGAILSNLSNARTTVGFDTEGQHRAFGYSFKVPHRNDRHVAPFKTYLARTWSIKCTHKMQEGTLSGTGLSNYGEHLAFFHNQVDILDNLGLFTGRGKFFAHV